MAPECWWCRWVFRAPPSGFATFGFAASSAIVFPSIPRSLYALDSPHTAHKLSARADRRQAALQQQEREREDQPVIRTAEHSSAQSRALHKGQGAKASQ